MNSKRKGLQTLADLSKQMLQSANEHLRQSREYAKHFYWQRWQETGNIVDYQAYMQLCAELEAESGENDGRKSPPDIVCMLSYDEMIDLAFYSPINTSMSKKVVLALQKAKKRRLQPHQITFIIPFFPAKGSIKIIKSKKCSNE